MGRGGVGCLVSSLPLGVRSLSDLVYRVDVIEDILDFAMLYAMILV